MTRVNAIPVEDLPDQHLIAEYRELPMVQASLRRTLESKKGLDRSRISNKYTLNTGHVYFFYDKGKHLRDRYRAVVKEMRKRGFKPDRKRKFPVNTFREHGLFKDWNPDPHAENVSRERIEQKVAMKPSWYRKTPHRR